MANGQRLTTNDFPRLYAILDATCFPTDEALYGFADDLLSAGVSLLQYRNKIADPGQMLSHARQLRRMAGDRVRLIMNDRADLCLAAGFDGVHLGQDDLPPEAARRIVRKPLWIGVSTHRPEQIRRADGSDADYLAIGPVFATSSKTNPDPVVGLEGVRAARALTRKPLVAIGGITRAHARSVIAAGADAVAVIADLLNDPRRAVEEFRQLLTPGVRSR